MFHTHNIATNRVVQSKYFKIIDLIVFNWHTGYFASEAEWLINSEMQVLVMTISYTQQCARSPYLLGQPNPSHNSFATYIYHWVAIKSK